MSDLKHMIQLPLDEVEASLLCASLALSSAVVEGNLEAQMTCHVALYTTIASMGTEKFNELVHRLNRLVEAGIPGAEFVDLTPSSECSHCKCSDSHCCWCGELKQ